MAYDPNEWGEWAGRENFVYKLRRLEEGLAEASWGASPEDIAAAVTNYLIQYPPMGINPEELEGAIVSYLTLNPPKGEIDPGEVAAAVLQYLEDNPIDPHPPGSELVLLDDAAPDPVVGQLWLNTDTGALMRWSTILNEWQPVGEASPMVAYHALALGRAQPGDVFSVSIGDTDPDSPTGSHAVAIGSEAAAPSVGDVVLGYRAKSTTDGSHQVVIGSQATSDGSTSVTMGFLANNRDGINNVIIGPSVQAREDSANSVAIGNSADVGPNAVAVGAQTDAGTGGSWNCTAVGNGATAEGTNATALGSGASATGAVSTSVGNGASASGVNGLALGVGASVSGPVSVAIGTSAAATHEVSIALGAMAATTADYQAMLAADELVVKPASFGPNPSSIVLYTAAGVPVRIGVVAGNLTLDGTPLSGGGGGGGPATIATETLTAAEDDDYQLDLGAVGQILDVTASGACRVRAYRTSAERTADASRPFATPYTAENGLLYDYLFTGAKTDLGRVWGYAGDVYVRVDGGPVDIDVRYVTTGVL